MTDPWDSPLADESFSRVVLQRLKFGARHSIALEMPALMNSIELSSEIDHITDRMILQLRAHVLAEQLPPQEIRHTVRVETNDPRHATWWDMFKDTHRGRWWMRWRSWNVRYVQTKVALERVVVVSVRDHWTYPTARAVLPESSWGHPVMVSTWTASDFPPRWRS